MPCYHLLPRAPIKPLIVSFAYLFLYHVNFNPQAQSSDLFMAAAKIFTYYVPINVYYSLAICTYHVSKLIKLLLVAAAAFPWFTKGLKVPLLWLLHG